MIAEPVNDFDCLGKFTEVARKATERSEVRQLADRFLARNDYSIEPALEHVRRWIRDAPQKNDTGHGPEPRVDCGAVQQRVNYLGRAPNCVERTIRYAAIAELIDPDSVRQMATIKTRAGLHTFPVENGEPVVLDPKVARNALMLGMHALRNGGSMRPHEMVAFSLELADEPARRYRNGRRRVDRAERALQTLWRGQLVGANPADFRNRLADIAWTFALAEQAARVAGGYGLDAVRLSAMAVQSMMEAQARNWSFSIGGYKVGVDVGAVTKAAKDVLKTAEHVAKKAGPLAGPALKAYLLSHGIPPQVVDHVAGQVAKSAGVDLGPLGLQTPQAGSFDALAFDAAVKQLAQTAPKTTARKG